MTAMKRCACGSLFTHPSAFDCAFCGGRACPMPGCGLAKQPEQPTCNRPACKRAYARVAKQKQAAKVAKFRRVV